MLRPHGAGWGAYPGSCQACFEDYGKGEVMRTRRSRPRPLRETGARPAERTAKSSGQLPGRGRSAPPGGDGDGRGCGGPTRRSMEARMVDPIPPYLSPERLKHLQQLADPSRLRAALYPSPKPPPVRSARGR